MLVFRDIRPKSDAVKAKNENRLMRVTRARWAIATVRSRCTFEEVLPIVAASQQLRDDPQKRVGVQQKMNPGADKNKSLNHQKPGAPKGLPIFALGG